MVYEKLMKGLSDIIFTFFEGMIVLSCLLILFWQSPETLVRIQEVQIEYATSKIQIEWQILLGKMMIKHTFRDPILSDTPYFLCVLHHCFVLRMSPCISHPIVSFHKTILGWYSTTLGTSSPAPTCMDLVRPFIHWNLDGFAVIQTGRIPYNGNQSKKSHHSLHLFSAENSSARPLTRSKLTHGYFLVPNPRPSLTTEVTGEFSLVSAMDQWWPDDLSYDRWIAIFNFSLFMRDKSEPDASQIWFWYVTMFCVTLTLMGMH